MHLRSLPHRTRRQCRPLTAALVAVAALGAAACGSKDSTAPAGPVDVRVFSLTTSRAEGGFDTATAVVIMDDTLHFTVKGDTLLTRVPSGTHTFKVVSSSDYLPFSFTQRLGGSAGTVVDLGRPGTCRNLLITGESQFCSGHNVLFWPGAVGGQRHTLVICPANDYGEFCTAIVDPQFFGLTWPDTGASAGNTYNFHGKLLIAATNNGNRMAMALYRAGDYAPRQRLDYVGTDSSRLSVEDWTDVRYLPIFPSDTPQLRRTEAGGVSRFGRNFGLSVTTTAYLPPGQTDVMLLRFDVKNISNTDAYRFSHPEEPAAGHTLTDIYLSPFLDPDIGGGYLAHTDGLDRSGDPEAIDDNATVFPADSLVMAYDESFYVQQFSISYSSRPGLIGMRLLAGPAGTTAKGVIVSTEAAGIDWSTPAREDTAYAIISGGRGGAIPAVCANSASAFICSREGGNNTRMGWSVGPVASLAPGQSTSLTVAILLAVPKAGTFASQTPITPQNADVTSTSRPIYAVAELLRTLAAAIKSLRVP